MVIAQNEQLDHLENLVQTLQNKEKQLLDNLKIKQVHILKFFFVQLIKNFLLIIWWLFI